MRKGRKEAHSGVYGRIHTLVCLIPPGRVSTYGQVARWIGCTARQVGYAMAATPSEEDIPWHRVVNSRGCISVRSCGFPDAQQRKYLEQEGIEFSTKGIIDLGYYGWNGEEL